MNQLVVISGCSGGGKSTLLADPKVSVAARAEIILHMLEE